MAPATSSPTRPFETNFLKRTRDLIQNLFFDKVALAVRADVTFDIVFQQLLEEFLLLAQFVEISATCVNDNFRKQTKRKNEAAAKTIRYSHIVHIY